jgi:hypothetical protein
VISLSRKRRSSSGMSSISPRTVAIVCYERHERRPPTGLGAELARRFGTQNARPATGQGRSPDPIVIVREPLMKQRLRASCLSLGKIQGAACPAVIAAGRVAGAMGGSLASAGRC